MTCQSTSFFSHSVLVLMIITKYCFAIHHHEKRWSISEPLKDQHLVVGGGIDTMFDFHMVRNGSGHVIRIEGVTEFMLQWLSAHFQFTWEPLHINETDRTKQQLADQVIQAMLKEECHLIVSISATSGRAALVDFSHTALYVPASYLIPKPISVPNMLAVVQPFDKLLWLAVIVAISILILLAYLFVNWYPVRVSDPDDYVNERRRMRDIPFLVFIIFANQSSHCPTKNLAVRIVICLSCTFASFILINYYVSLLTSYFTAPNPHPLIKSIDELKHRPDINLVTDKNTNIDAILSSAVSGFYKDLGDKLRAYPNSRCPTSKKCIEMVKSGSHVYLSGMSGFLLRMMKEDFYSTGTCNLEMGEEVFNLYLAWAVHKNNRGYLDALNKGLTLMRQYGLTRKWERDRMPDPHQCFDMTKGRSKKKQQDDVVISISTRNMLGTFPVLLLGYFVALTIFIIEKVAKAWKDRGSSSLASP